MKSEVLVGTTMVAAQERVAAVVAQARPAFPPEELGGCC
jgi:hypothetical protein